MRTKIYLIAIIKKGNSVLLRKKFDGSGPYRESWYLLGEEVDPKNNNFEQTMIKSIKRQTGLTVIFSEKLGWDTEIKKDKDRKDTFFIYLDCVCKYVSGKLRPDETIERLEWVSISNLKNYDLVPPTRKLFKKLGYLKKS